MGMSASQARMLSLTARLSDLELQAQSISNSKITLANQSEQLSKTYETSLNQQKFKVFNSDSSSYVDASAYNLTTYDAVSTSDKQRFIKDSSGKVLVTTAVGSAYDKTKNQNSTSYYLKNGIDSSSYYGTAGSTGYKTVADFLKAELGYASKSDATSAGKTYNEDEVNYYTSLYSGKEEFLNSMGYTSATTSVQETDSNYTSLNGSNTYTYSAAATKYYSNVYDEIAKSGYDAPGDANMSDSSWLESQVESGSIYLYTYDNTGGTKGTGDWANVSWNAGDSSIEEVADTTGTTAAEAEYNAKLDGIQSQDKKFDMELQAINTEHQALQTEIDSVKKVINKNIETSYKTFNA